MSKEYTCCGCENEIHSGETVLRVDGETYCEFCADKSAVDFLKEFFNAEYYVCETDDEYGLDMDYNEVYG